MAEESIDPLPILEKIESGGRESETCAGDSESVNNGDSAHANHRRASISSISISDSVRSTQKPLPHYLRASTGSCHDFCKFGRKHAFEEKVRRPLRKRLQKPNDPSFVHIFVSGEKKRENVVKQLSSVDTISHSPDSKPSDVKSHSPTPKVVKQKYSPDLKLYPDSTKKFLKTTVKKTMVVKQNPPIDSNNHSPGLKPFPKSKSHSSKSRTSPDAEIYCSKQNGLSVNKTSLPNKPLHAKKFPSPDQPETVKREIQLPSKRIEVPAKKSYSTDGKISRIEKQTDQISYAGKSKPYKVKPSSSSGNSGGVHGKEVKAVRKKPLAPSAATLSPKHSLSKTAPIKARKARDLPKDRNKFQRAGSKVSKNEKVMEKTLHVIETETETNSSESKSDANVIPLAPSPSSEKSSSNGNSSYLSQEKDDQETEYSGNDRDKFSSDKNKSMEIGEVVPVKENNQKMLKRSKAPEVKYHSPMKLKFRSGKVVELHSYDNTPRRLRFRRARILGADQGKGDLSRKTFKKAGGDNKSGADLSSEKVSLKHQDMQGKKDAQGLLNNVIEETASKLVESRKSKVKALVGAFETVISLHESKPSPHVVN